MARRSDNKGFASMDPERRLRLASEIVAIETVEDNCVVLFVTAPELLRHMMNRRIEIAAIIIANG